MLIKNDQMIDKLLLDSALKVYESGIIYSKYSKNGRLTNKWRRVGSVRTDGYIIFTYQKHSLFTHRVVAKKFLTSVKPDMEINHKDGNPKNNDVSNLEVVSHSENMKHSYRILKRTKTKLIGKDNPKHKKFIEIVLNQKEDIEEAIKSKLSLTKKAKKLGITRTTLKKRIDFIKNLGGMV